MKNITGLLIRTDGSRASFKTIPANLESYYKTLDCELIDIVNRQIGYDKAYRFNIICDDEALLKSPAIASAIDHSLDYCLYGNLFVVGVDKETGDVRSLTKDEQEHLRLQHSRIFVPHSPESIDGLIRVTY